MRDRVKASQERDNEGDLITRVEASPFFNTHREDLVGRILPAKYSAVETLRERIVGSRKIVSGEGFEEVCFELFPFLDTL